MINIKLNYFCLSFTLFILLLFQTREKILNLDDYNYALAIEKHQICIISFQNDTCYSCSQTKILLEELDNYYTQKKADICVGMLNIDSPDTEIIREDYQLDTIPTIIITTNKNKEEPYHFIRQTNAFITYINKFYDSSVKNLTTVKDIEDFINPKTSYLNVIVLNEKVNLTAFQKFNSLTNFHDTAICSNDVCKKYFNAENNDDADFIINSNFEPKEENVFLKYKDFEELINQVFLHSLPNFTNFSEYSVDLLFKREMDSIFFTFCNTSDANEVNRLNIFKESFISFFKKGELLSYILTIENPDDINTLDFFGHDKKEIVNLHDIDKTNRIFIVSPKGRANFKVYDFKNEITKKNLEEFFDDYKKNNLVENLMTIGEPEKHPKENLKFIVGKTFEKEILKNEKQIVVMVYLSFENCDKCLLVKDIFYKLADEYAKKKEILFAFMDPFYNRSPMLPEKIFINELPIIEIYGLNKKEKPKRFIGEKKYENIKEYIDENTSKNAQGTKNDL